MVIPVSNRPQYLRMALIPEDSDHILNGFNLHPNLLHVNLKQNKKNRSLKVWLICKVCALADKKQIGPLTFPILLYKLFKKHNQSPHTHNVCTNLVVQIKDFYNWHGIHL